MAHILLIMNPDENSRLLIEVLSVQHPVDVFEPGFELEGGYESLDLCVLDEPSLARFESWIRTVKHSLKPAFLPCLLLARRPNFGVIAHHLGGAIDEIISIPVSTLELELRVNMLLRVRDSAKQVLALVNTDDLTGVYNRRYCFTLGGRELARTRRSGNPLSAIMLDLDHFKLINDKYGHPAGDRVLRDVAVCCRGQLRETDILGRYEGEAFFILLPDTAPPGAVQVAERLRQAIAAAVISTASGGLRVTASLGVASGDDELKTIDELVNRADTALLTAKGGGRNRVCVEEGAARNADVRIKP